MYDRHEDDLLRASRPPEDSWTRKDFPKREVRRVREFEIVVLKSRRLQYRSNDLTLAGQETAALGAAYQRGLLVWLKYLKTYPTAASWES